MLLYFLIFLFAVCGCGGISLDQDLALTYSQKQALDKFKKVVVSRLPHDYMKEDIYLVRGLRARDFKVKEAESMLMENLAWRTQNKMDEIQKEDWTDFRREYKYLIDGTDKEGRPILVTDAGEWDIRRGVLAGKGPQMSRLIDKALDEVNFKVRELQSQGQNVTQYYHIFNMEGYNLVQGGCPICIPIAIRFVTSYEALPWERPQNRTRKYSSSISSPIANPATLDGSFDPRQYDHLREEQAGKSKCLFYFYE